MFEKNSIEQKDSRVGGSEEKFKKRKDVQMYKSVQRRA